MASLSFDYSKITVTFQFLIKYIYSLLYSKEFDWLMSLVPYGENKSLKFVESLRFSWAHWISSELLLIRWDDSGWRLVIRKTPGALNWLGFQGERNTAGDRSQSRAQWFSQSCLGSDIPINPGYQSTVRSHLAGEQWCAGSLVLPECLGERAPQKLCVLVSSGLTRVSPHWSSLICILCHKTVMEVIIIILY